MSKLARLAENCRKFSVWSMQRPQPSDRAESETTVKMSEIHMPKCEISADNITIS